MKKNTKRILSLILVLMMVVSLFPSAYAAETEDPFVDEDYGSAWGDWDDQPAEEPAPVEEEPAEDPFIEEPAEDPFVEEPVEEPAPVEEPVEEPIPVEEPVEEPVPVEEPAVEEEPVEVPCPANTFYYVGGSGLRVTVDAPEGAFPIDAEMSVSELPASFVQDVVAASGVEGQVLVAADISFANGEGELQPNGKVKVSITSAEAARVSNVKVVHIDDDYNVEEVNQLPEFDANVLFTDAVATMSVADERTLSFEADSFSVYAIIGEVVIVDDEGSFDFESEDYKITVSYTADAQIPLGTHLVVSEIPYDSAEYWDLWQQSFDKLNENAIKPQDDPGEMGTYKSIAFARFFDVSLIFEGEEFEPAVPLQVEISFKDGGLPQFDGEQTKVIHFGDKGTELIEDLTVGSSVAGLPEGMPVGAAVNDFTYMQDGFSVVGVFTTDAYVNAEAAEPAAGGVSAAALLGAVRAAGDPTIAAGKTVTDNNGDGIYELALNIKATSQQSSSTSVTKSNVVMVIDVSGSMGNDDSWNYYDTYTYNADTYDEYRYYTSSTSTNTRLYYGTYRTGGRNSTAYTGWYSGGYEDRGRMVYCTAYSGTVYAYETRLHATQRAACAVVDALLAYNVNDDNITDIFEITVVKFANKTANTYYGYNGTEMVIRDSTSASAIKAAINGLTAGGGTNWEAALQQALSEANYFKNTDPSRSTDPVENTSVIFLTDGFPTFYGNDSGTGGENNDNISNSYSPARDDARNIVSNGFTLYNIFAFGSDTTTYNNHTGHAYLRALTNYAYGTGTSNNYNETDVTRQYCFNAKSTADLVKAFETIIDHITNNVGFAGVNLNDGVSLGATSTSVAVNGTAKPESMRYTVKDESGKIVYTVKIDSSGKATFTIYNADGTTKTLTDNEVENKTVTINSTNISCQVYSVTDGTGDDAPTYQMAPATIDASTGMVNWNLAALGILESGYTYTVAFDVWPNQVAYDICADLNNGIYTSVDAALDAYNVPAADRQHIKDALVHNADGSYSLKTNYEQSVEYYPATSETNDQGETTWTYGNKQTQEIDPPAPIPLQGSSLPLAKVWESNLAISELNELLWENGVVDGTSKQYKITLHVWKAETQDEINAIAADQSGHTPYISKELGWDTSVNPAKYDWEKDVAVAPGMMLNVTEAANLGYDTTDSTKIKKFTNDSGDTLEYYVIEAGHYYCVSEDGGDLHFYLDEPIYHPMIVDGTLYNVFFGSGQTVDRMDPMYSVAATNYLKGGLNITKIVKDFENKNVEGVEDEFAFIITLWNDEDGTVKPVYTYDDQFKADNTAISGSIGYREFDGHGNTLGRDVVIFEDSTNASERLATNNKPTPTLDDDVKHEPVYAKNVGGKTQITLRMPANGEIRIVNLPNHTKFTVKEVLDTSEAPVYEYVQSESLLKYSKENEETHQDEEVIEVLATDTNNLVSGTITGNKANVARFTNKTDGFFYVYHSSDVTVEKIPFTDNRVKGTYDAEKEAYNYEFNLALETKSGFIYGGYYKAYSKSSGDTAVKALTFTGTDTAKYTYDTAKVSDTKGWGKDSGGTVYVGDTTTWVKGDAYTDQIGLAMRPKADTVYYLKEVPDIYLTPGVYTVYDEVAGETETTTGKMFYPVKKLYMITVTDDKNYSAASFDVSVSSAITAPTGTPAWEPQIEVKKNGEVVDTITPTSTLNKQGFMVLLDATSLIKQNAYYREIPYHVTLDGVKVTGIRQMTVFVRNTTINIQPGWIKPGMTRTTISKKAAVQLSE